MPADYFTVSPKGWKWVPDPTLRSRYGQPGGWIYQLLPYLEEQAVYDLLYAVAS